jgi:hypothetical protein
MSPGHLSMSGLAQVPQPDLRPQISSLLRFWRRLLPMGLSYIAPTVMQAKTTNFFEGRADA